MDLQVALKQLREEGYCLWVGAGVSMHLASASNTRVPDWNVLTAKLEEAAGLTPPAGSHLSLPERLEVALRKVGREAFQKELRRCTLDALALAVLDAADQRKHHTDSAIVPPQAGQIARLGYGANPIVNFNIEHLTSIALAAHRRGHGIQLKAFSPPLPDNVTGWRATRSTNLEDGSYRRHVLHPHGAIDMYGMCVITDGEYRGLNGTLGLQLAVHAAFRSHLFIVGMSLEDEYLRAQIAAFRPFIERVFWVRAGDVDERDLAWAYRYDVDVLRVNTWPEFWSQIKVDFDEAFLADQWVNLVTEATQCLRPDDTLARIRSMSDGKVPQRWSQAWQLRGRVDEPRVVFPRPPSRFDEAEDALVRYACKFWGEASKGDHG